MPECLKKPKVELMRFITRTEISAIEEKFYKTIMGSSSYGEIQ